MTAASPGFASEPVSATFEIKSSQLPLVALMLKTADWSVLARDLARQFGPDGTSPDFFDNDAMLIDFSALPSRENIADLPSLLRLLQSYHLIPVAARAGNPTVMSAALTLGLVAAPEAVKSRNTRVTEKLSEPKTIVQEVIREVRVEVPVAMPAPGTLVIDKPLRSGQKIYAKGCDLVVLAMVNQGAEVVADGNIHVYAPLRGKAMAGAHGDTSARIFSICLEPELISIAGIYRTSEHPLPDGVRSKAAQVRLAGDAFDKMLIEPLNT
jgi:septum site-determining protein MinC